MRPQHRAATPATAGTRGVPGTASIAALAAVTLLATAACAAGHTPGQAPGSARTHGPSASAASTANREMIARQYLAIATAGNRRLERDFDGLDGPDRANLARAEADLHDAAATEHLFDQRLQLIVFPPATERIARALVWLNESRAALTTKAAASTSLAELHRYEPLLSAANAPVEQAVRLIRSELGLPPPDTS